MAFYQKTLDDRIVGAVAGSSPGTGWTPVANFPTMVTNARTANRLLYLLPGTYHSTQIDLTTSTGGGNPLTITAELGTVTIQLSGSAPYLLKSLNVDSISISNISFDGNNISLNEPVTFPGLIRFSGSGIGRFIISGCNVFNTPNTGISCDGSVTGKIIDNHINNCGNGIVSLDSLVNVERNRVTYCHDNGVQIWTSSINGNNSVVSDNYITNINNLSGGTGQYGNGIVVYKANCVKILNNVIGTTNFSSIRLNQGSNCQVIGNFCFAAREVAMFIECPGPGGGGGYLVGGVISNNIIDSAGGGINIVNLGLADDGVTRRITVSSNQLYNITRNYISEYSAYTPGIGILAEGGSNIVGNSVESAAIAGIQLGTNNAAIDLTASGNFLKNTNIGIGYSANPASAGILISSNLISGYTFASSPSDPNYVHSGAIVSVSYIGGPTNTYQRDAPGGIANADYGNSTQTTVGTLTVGLNSSQ